MKTISIYDAEAEIIDKMSDDFNTTSAEVIEALLIALNDNGIDIIEYL